MRNRLTAAILLLSFGCAPTIKFVPLDWRLVDHPEESRIELLWLNGTSKTVCLDAEAWPNQAGKMNQMSKSVFLVVGAERFPIEDFNTGYCPYGCTPLYVGPGEQISGSIPYRDFDLPERLRYEPKKLEFSPPHGWVCRWVPSTKRASKPVSGDQQ